MVLLWMFCWEAQHTRTLAGVAFVLMQCFSVLGVAHVAILKLRSRSKFPVVWVLLSVAGSYGRYHADLRMAMGPYETLLAHLALTALILSFAHCVLVSPGQISSGQGLQGKGEDKLLRKMRAGRCDICRCAFQLRDHHCVWVGQCVAQRNRRSFLSFLILLAGLAVWFSCRVLEVDGSTSSSNTSRPLWEDTGGGMNNHCPSLFRRRRTSKLYYMRPTTLHPAINFAMPALAKSCPPVHLRFHSLPCYEALSRRHCLRGQAHYRQNSSSASLDAMGVYQRPVGRRRPKNGPLPSVRARKQAGTINLFLG
ncbi:unnamed protein product [Discosporangium mesarthrocarpum]